MINSARMRRIETLSEKHGVSKQRLMENAGKAVCSTLGKWFNLRDHYIIIFCGSGNNGGDGFVAARRLARKTGVAVLLFGDETRLPPEAAANLARIQEDERIEIMRDKDISEESVMRIAHKILPKQPILLDAMLGTGVKGQVREPIASGIMIYNKLHGKKVAIDIPSGIDPDTGKPAGMMAVSDKIITFHDTKPGLARFHDVTITDIGVPTAAVRESMGRHNRRTGMIPKINWPWKSAKEAKTPQTVKR